MLRSYIVFLIFTSGLIAQTKSDSVRSLQPPAQKDTFFLQVQRPDKDTIQIYTSHYRIAACTRPGAQAFINGKKIKVYPSGAFVDLADVKVGMNTLCFTVKSAAGDSLSKEFVIIRPEQMKDSPHDTLVIEEAMMEPSQDMWLMSGDILEVKFKGSPGWEASFTLPGIASNIPMRELSPQEADGFSGIYFGRYKIKPNDELRDEQIKFRLKKSFWSREKAYSTAKISIFSKELPRVAELIGQRPYLNAGLGDDRLGGAKLGFLRPGVRVEIIGKVGSQYRVRLSETMEAWLPEEFAKLMPLDTPLPRALTGSITAMDSGSEDIVTLALSDKVPYTSEQSVNPTAIIVDVYGATSNTNWIAQPPALKGIENITWQQIEANHFRMLITFRHRQHWGYDIDYARNLLRIKIRRPPTNVSRDSVLQKLIIAIDAGHGGDNNRGAIGATGALEKDLTNSIVNHLGALLTSKGVRVVFTRTEDEGLSMEYRINKIVRSGAQLLVSIHCNSAGEASDPIAIQGVSTYYQPIGFKSLAETIYDKMLVLGLQPFGVIGNFNFMLNSVTQMPNVLVETAFLSHPEEEILLLDDKFQKKVAVQITAGLEEFVRNNSELKEKNDKQKK